MSDLAIRVENLGKQYRIGAKQEGYNRFTEQVMDSITAPIRRAKQALQRSNEQTSSRSNDIIWALKDVSFEVERGEVVGIIGRNGAGKSTLLKILSRITEPTTGRVELHGRVSSLLEVGTGFHPELTGRENVFLNGAILGMRREEIEHKFDEIVTFSGVEQFLDTPVKRYSSGMQVRLAFAVAAHLEPEILLVDEVLAVGDAEFQRKCLGKMGEVARGGRTVLFVSHNMAAVRNLCERGILLDEGAVHAAGPMDQVVAEYLASDMRADRGEATLPPAGPVVRGTLRTTGEDGETRSQFAIGEPWRVHLRFETRESVPGAIAAVGIWTVEGIPITSLYSRELDVAVGQYEVSFVVGLPLNACQLRVGVGISSRRQAVYYVTDLSRVEIVSVAANRYTDRSMPRSGLLVSSIESTVRPLSSVPGGSSSSA